MKRTVCLLGLLLISTVGRADDRQEVQSTVESFLKDLGGMQYDKLAGYFTPKALLIVVRKTDTGFASSFQTVDELIARLKGNPNPRPFEEPLANVAVTIDSGYLAYLRADFKVVREGSILSSGVDQFTLVKEGGAWKIAAAAYTSIPEPR